MLTQVTIQRAIAAGRAVRFANSDQLSLGQIIDKCEEITVCADPQRVVFDFEYIHPTGLDSWRGVYSEIALQFSYGGVPMTLPEFLSMAQGAVGKTYEGYKGGEYTMTRETPVWVANYGNSGCTAVTGLLDEGWQVVLLTGYTPN